VAGSAAAFKKVDRDYVAAAAKLAQAAVVRYFGLVTAAGANAKMWASDLAPFHPLLYTRTKGEVGGVVWRVLSKRAGAVCELRSRLEQQEVCSHVSVAPRCIQSCTVNSSWLPNSLLEPQTMPSAVSLCL
jgi:hypothetical protein